jgi:hypothetical protein
MQVPGPFRFARFGGLPMTKKPAEEFDEKEAQRRFEAALKGAMNAPHKPLKEKPKVKKAAKKSRRAKEK